MELITNNTFHDFGMNSLNKFMNGNIAENYTIQEEQGFPIQGSVGAILNVDKKNKLDTVNNGLIINTKVDTNEKYKNRDYSNIGINEHSNRDKDWVNPIVSQPSTPLKFCNTNQNSELLPNYPNGIENKNITPTCNNLTINGVGSPMLYGASTYGVNDPSLLTNPQNNIGHEIEPYGVANDYGFRAIGQGKNSCKPMMPGFNVPTLELSKNNNGSYLSSPTTFNKDIPLYQVGNWTEIPNNYLSNYENSEFCN